MSVVRVHTWITKLHTMFIILKYLENLESWETVNLGLGGSDGAAGTDWVSSGLDWLLDGSGISASDFFTGISVESISAMSSSPGIDANYNMKKINYWNHATACDK